MDEHSGQELKGDVAAAVVPEAERELILSALAQRIPSTVADVEAATGLKLMPKTLRSLNESIAILATHPCVERPDKRAHICLTPKTSWEQGVRSDALLVSLLKIKRAEKTHLFSRAELQKALPRPYGALFKAEFDARKRERRWPAGVAALTKAGKTYVFSLEDMQGPGEKVVSALAYTRGEDPAGSAGLRERGREEAAEGRDEAVATHAERSPAFVSGAAGVHAAPNGAGKSSV